MPCSHGNVGSNLSRRTMSMLRRCSSLLACWVKNHALELRGRMLYLDHFFGHMEVLLDALVLEPLAIKTARAAAHTAQPMPQLPPSSLGFSTSQLQFMSSACRCAVKPASHSLVICAHWARFRESIHLAHLPLKRKCRRLCSTFVSQTVPSTLKSSSSPRSVSSELVMAVVHAFVVVCFLAGLQSVLSGACLFRAVGRAVKPTPSLLFFPSTRPDRIRINLWPPEQRRRATKKDSSTWRRKLEH